MKSFDNNPFSANFHYTTKSSHPATLLVAEDVLPILNKRLLEKRCGLNAYLRFLVYKSRYLLEESSLPPSLTLTTRYQACGQSLQCVNFRVSPVVWHLLKLIARAHGISICLAFSILLMMDHQGEPDRVLTPSRRSEPLDDIFSVKYTEKMNLGTSRVTRETNFITNWLAYLKQRW